MFHEVGLTDSEKIWRITDLERLLALQEPDVAACEMLTKINAVSGVCTTSVCTGHYKEGTKRNARGGYLGLRLSTVMMRWMREHGVCYLVHAEAGEPIFKVCIAYMGESIGGNSLYPHLQIYFSVGNYEAAAEILLSVLQRGEKETSIIPKA